jgi:hypothetical protein
MTIEKLNKFLMGLDYFPMGKCACKGSPFVWKHQSGFEIKLYNDGTWKLINGQLLRYGYIETAIEEIKDFYEQLLG